MGDSGETSCDYRGGGELGAGPNDQHRTIKEIDPASEEDIAKALSDGPAANAGANVFENLLPGWVDQVASILGLEGTGPVGLRVGVWDQ